ncbi:histone-lysine N-methyltransferase SETMAR [Plakobranchus ocellatus]|uniref:Histone-lysine N-methyltransferase SETMAR n=1 Tax=Plakobranchus ocellatus TaxID=259542 RepID=A0AAV3YPS0_9GAST|nr:histone-lysine N-methyltransferase SETMAR [Plakobranchus ocellatus]
MINLAIAKSLSDGSPKCCQMSRSARESKSPNSCCTGVNKKVMKPLMWGLSGTIVPGTSFLNTSSLEIKLGYTCALQRQNATQRHGSTRPLLTQKSSKSSNRQQK